MTKSKKVLVSVINDLSTDQRVNRSCMTLKEMGYEVTLVGRAKSDSQPLSTREYACKRMHLLFESGPLFYLEFNLRLFIFLLFRPSDLYFSNDLDTLLPNYCISKLKGGKLIYDSHEIFCEVPELVEAPTKKKIWEKIEKSIVPKLKYCITVNRSISNWFYEKYKTKFVVVRNIPSYVNNGTTRSRIELNLPVDKKIVLLQGAGINVQRGAEEIVAAMQYLEGVLFLVIGGGDVIEELKQQSKSLQLEEKITFFPKMSASDLFHYTSATDIGITIDKDTNVNYHFSLPNKIFDYMHAGIPILASPLPEIKAIISKYNIGDFIQDHQPKNIAAKIQEMLNSSSYTIWKSNLKKAAEENNWLTEKETLISLVKSAEAE